MRRTLVIAALLILMAGFGVGVNRYLAGTTRVHQINDSSVRGPGDVTTGVDLPGTLFVAQRGRLFRLTGRHFTELTPGRSGEWMQPASANDGSRLIAVLRGGQSSDLFMLDGNGRIVRQLTRLAARSTDADHWVFWPRMNADASRLFTSYDSPKEGYNVDFAIWSGNPESGVFAHRWSTPIPYTGGDVHPAPLPTGGLVYSHYEILNGKVYSQLVIRRAFSGEAVPLTRLEDDCDQASVSPDGGSVAMICSQSKQSTRLATARLQGATLTSMHVAATDCLCASPSWAPDGSGLAYIAPADASGHFQLWWLGVAAGGPQSPVRVTSNLDLDATSPPAWLSGAAESPPSPSPTAHAEPGTAGSAAVPGAAHRRS